MGKTTENGITEFFGRERERRERALDMHLKVNFYPPHSRDVVDDIINAFKKFWDDRREGEYKITLEQLADECHLTSVDGLGRYFETFIDWEEEEDLY